MRVVQFENTGSVVAYPAEGITAFGHTVRVGDIIVGEYNGAAGPETLQPYVGAWPPTAAGYKTELNPGEVLILLGAVAYAAVYAAAYPKDATPVDPQALFFLESAKHPYSANGLITVNEPPVTTALQYFVAMGYITQDDADRVIRGKPI